MDKYLGSLTSKPALDFIAKFENFFAKAPHLPKSWRKFLAKITPWFVLLGGIGGVIGGISTLSGGDRLNQMSVLVSQFAQINPNYFVLTGVISIISGILLLIAFQPLRNKELKGWVYLFWNTLLGLVQMTLAVVFAASSIVGAALGALIGFYFLFELKSDLVKKAVSKE